MEALGEGRRQRGGRKVFKGLHTKSKLVVSLSPSSSCKACRAAPKSPGPTKPTISAEEGLTKRRKSRPHHPACRAARPPAVMCFHLKYASCCADNPHWCPPWLWPSGNCINLGNLSQDCHT